MLPGLRKILLSLDTGKDVGDKLKRGYRVLKSFLAGVKFAMGDVEITLDYPPEKGAADSGQFDADLSDVLVALGEAASESGTAAAIVIDEMQYLSESELKALIMAFHTISQEKLPVILVGAGLPQLAGNTGRAKSYAERLFIFPQVGPLKARDARIALQEPVRAEGVVFSINTCAPKLGFPPGTTTSWSATCSNPRTSPRE